MISNAFGNTLVIVMCLHSGSEDDNFKVEKDPPKGGRVCHTLGVGLLWVVVVGGAKDQPDGIPRK